MHHRLPAHERARGLAQGAHARIWPRNGQPGPRKPRRSPGTAGPVGQTQPGPARLAHAGPATELAPPWGRRQGARPGAAGGS